MKKKLFNISLALMCVTVLCSCGKVEDKEKNKEITDVPSVSATESPSETATATPTCTPTESVTPEPTWSPSSLKDGLITAIEYDKKYDAVVNSAEDAIKVVKMYGDMQKKNYNNPAITAIENKMEEEFDIVYVALGEIDEETANDIYAGFKYMYETYPEIKGTLTDFTLGNFSWNAMAQTRAFEFVTNAGSFPMVLKREIIISAASFLNRKNLLSSCEYNEETGFWPKNASVSMIVVHELGHHVLDVHNAKLHGFTGNYVSKDNFDNYVAYCQEGLSWNQEEAKRIMAAAYTEWSKTNKGSEEDFRASISTYAKGIQADCGVSYSETFAEAVADIYANGENAAQASKLILEAIK